MSQEIDYATELKKFLWERLKRKNESLEKFEKRIEDCYFCEKVLDYKLLPKIINDPDAEPDVMREWVFGGNYVFLITFGTKAKSRLKTIQTKIDQITKDHHNPHYCQNVLLFYLLSILYGEKSLKQEVWDIKRQRKPEIQSIEKDIGSLLSSIDNLRKFLSKKVTSSKNPFFQKYYQEDIINPIRDKALKCGLSKEKLDELSQFIEERITNQLTELIESAQRFKGVRKETEYYWVDRNLLKILFDFLKKDIGIAAEQAKRYIAELFDLFEIRRIQDIIEEYDARGEALDCKQALQISAKRIGDVIHKAR